MYSPISSASNQHGNSSGGSYYSASGPASSLSQSPQHSPVSQTNPPYRTTAAAFIVYSLLGALLIGTVVAVIHRPTTEPRIIYLDAGYWLAILLGGLLVYDGMLRTENLLWHLDSATIIRNQHNGPLHYKQLRKTLAASLSTNIKSVPYYSIVAGVFVALFILIDIFNLINGRTTLYSLRPLDFPLNILRAGFSFFLVIVAYQFIILTTFFYRTTTVTLQNNSTSWPLLGYHPFHSDGVRGYADLGTFAIRVNLILIITGLYLAYQTYLRGMTPESLIPFIVYAIIAGTWFYASFWRLHRTMLRERTRWREHQGPPPGTKPLTNTAQAQDTHPDSLADAPVWPISDRALQSIIFANLLPFIIGLMNIIVTG